MTLKREALGDETVSTSVTCQQTTTSITGGSRGESTWSPPKCWWEQITLDEFIQGYVRLNASIHHWGEDASTWAEQFRSYYQNSHSTDNSGNWYQVYCEPDATDAERAATGWDQIPGDWQWIPTGNPSPVGTAPTVNNATLALIAAEQMPIPATKVSMWPDSTAAVNPAAQIVNLPTYFWLDRKQYAAQSMTAQLKPFGLSATVMAVPEELDITVDGGVAFTAPTSGGKAASRLACPANADGSIGTAYAPGTVSNCSLTFL